MPQKKSPEADSSASTYNQSQGLPSDYGKSGYVARSRDKSETPTVKGQSATTQVAEQGGFAAGGGTNSGRGGKPNPSEPKEKASPKPPGERKH